MLNGVRQFVRDERVPFCGMRRKLTAAKGDVVAEREGARVESVGGAFGLSARMNADPSEVMAEPRLEPRPGRGIERLPR